MNREQLKASLERLSPSEEQRKRMLDQIHKGAPSNKRLPFFKLGAALAALFALFFLYTELLPFGENNKSAPMAAEAPTADQAVTESVSMAGSESLHRGADYDFLLEHTPWKAEQTPASLPVFAKQNEDKEDGLQTERMEIPGEDYTYSVPVESTYEAQIVAFLVHYSIRYSDGTTEESQVSMVRTVQVKSYDQALEELSQGKNSKQRAVQQSQVQSGQLLYVEQDDELIPIYRFKVQDEWIDVQAIK